MWSNLKCLHTAYSYVHVMLLCPQKEGGYVEHFNVLRRVLMQFLERLFGSDANDSTVQTGCNILKVHSMFTGLSVGR